MKPFPKWLVLTSSLAAGLTGVVYWWMDHMMAPLDEWAVINHPLQPWVLKAHIISAPLLVFAVGLITVDHIWKHFRSPATRARRSGAAAMWAVAPMVLSGYLVQAVTELRWLTVLGWLHVIAGLLFTLGLTAHQLAVVRSRGDRRAIRRQEAPTGPLRTGVPGP